MKEATGNIWDYKYKGLIVIPTNGFIKNNGANVMGRGLALDVQKMYPRFPFELGSHIKSHGNIVTEWPHSGLITFPVKHNWYEDADPQLIIQSVDQLKRVIGQRQCMVYMPRVGCGNGKLKWELVKPLLEELDDRFTIVSL